MTIRVTVVVVMTSQTLMPGVIPLIKLLTLVVMSTSLLAEYKHVAMAIILHICTYINVV